MTKEAVIFLFIAIVVEVIATISLKLSDSFTRLVDLPLYFQTPVIT